MTRTWAFIGLCILILTIQDINSENKHSCGLTAPKNITSTPPWKNKYFVLSNEIQLPAIGLGTWQIIGQESVDLAVQSALKEGYTLIDTASVYRNEALIANSITKRKNISRQELFLTSKLAPKDQGREKAKLAFEQTLHNLQTDYLDLYLIHWPGVQGIRFDDSKNKILRKESWETLEELYEKGLVKAIGVSNYNLSHLKELLSYCKIKPHVNQIEVHPHYQQLPLVEFCQGENIHITAYSSLGTTHLEGKNPLLTEPTVKKISKSKGQSPSQILLSWALQKGFSVIPKSTNPDHIKENITLEKALDDEEMKMLDNLEKGHKYCWNPERVS